MFSQPGEQRVTGGGWTFATPSLVPEAFWRIRTVRALQLVIALLVVANLGRVPLLSTGDREAPLLLNDLCMMFMVLVAALAGATARSFRVDRLTMLAMLFASVGAYAALLATARYGLTAWQLVISLAYLGRWLLYFGLYVVIINGVRSEDVMTVWHSLERAILVFAAFGLVQAVFIPHFAQVVYPSSRVIIDFDEQGHRLVSTVLEPNMAGAMIMLVLLVQLAQLAGGARLSSWKPLVLLSALVATLSRSSFLGLMTGGIVILLVRGVSRRVLRAFVVLVLLGLAAAPRLLVFAASYNKLGIDASALTRVASWIRAFRIIADHPVIGIGFNTYAFVQESYGYVRMGNGTYSLDGGLLFIAVMTGVVGVALYVGMLTLVVRRCRAVWRDPMAPPEWRALSTGIAASTVALCVHSVFVNSLLTPFVMEPLFILWALSFLIARDIRREAARPSVPFALASSAIP